MKLIMNRHVVPVKCKICTKLDSKERFIRKEEERIRRWRKEHGPLASISKAEEDINTYQCDIQKILHEREVWRGNVDVGEARVPPKHEEEARISPDGESITSEKRKHNTSSIATHLHEPTKTQV
jgi:hypothetical protein